MHAVVTLVQQFVAVSAPVANYTHLYYSIGVQLTIVLDRLHCIHLAPQLLTRRICLSCRTQAGQYSKAR